jgi:hypothetical protein
MRIAKQNQERGAYDPRLPDGMPQILQVLLALHEYLANSVEVTQEQLQSPLMQLLTAIADLADGRAPELFQPAQRAQNHPGMSVAEANLMGIAALAMDQLMRAGHTRSDAAKAVARTIEAAGHSVPHRFSAATVAGWRDRLREGPGVRTPNVALLRFNAPLPAEAGNTPRIRAEWLLKMICVSVALRW